MSGTEEEVPHCYRLTDGTGVWMMETQGGDYIFFAPGGHDVFSFLHGLSRELSDETVLVVDREREQTTVGAMRAALCAYDALIGKKGTA